MDEKVDVIVYSSYFRVISHKGEVCIDLNRVSLLSYTRFESGVRLDLVVDGNPANFNVNTLNDAHAIMNTWTDNRP